MFTKATSVNKKLKVLVYGASGSGKTHFALTFPKPAVIDTEGGTELFSDRFDFDVLRTKDFNEVLKAVETASGYETVVIDPVTVLWQVIMEAGQIAAENRQRAKNRNPDEATLTPRDWGVIKRKVNALYTRLVNMPCHVVVAGRIKDINEQRGNEVTKVGERVDAEKSTEYLFDIIVKLQVDKDGKRWGIIEKDRSGKLQGKRIQDPSFATFADILKTMQAGKTTVKAQDPTQAAETVAAEFDDTQLDADIAHAVEVVEAELTAEIPGDCPTKVWGEFVKYATEHIRGYDSTTHVYRTLIAEMSNGDESWKPVKGMYLNGDPAAFWKTLVAHAAEKAQA
jgi:hypothetical protein